MCGRYTLRATPQELLAFFQLLKAPYLLPLVNICPTQSVPAIVFDPETTTLRCEEFRWGLIPSWTKEPVSGAPLINARGETVATRPAFRSSFKRRRCLIPASGFYEWQSVPGRKKKQPVYIGLRDQPILAFAGLWDCWKVGENQEIRSCTIITTQANAAMAQVHNRMPVILQSELIDEWLDPSREVEELTALLRPSPSEEMVLSAEIADELLSGKPSLKQQTLF